MCEAIGSWHVSQPYVHMQFLWSVFFLLLGLDSCMTLFLNGVQHVTRGVGLTLIVPNMMNIVSGNS
jgi:hypothetical protein